MFLETFPLQIIFRHNWRLFIRNSKSVDVSLIYIFARSIFFSELLLHHHLQLSLTFIWQCDSKWCLKIKKTTCLSIRFTTGLRPPLDNHCIEIVYFLGAFQLPIWIWNVSIYAKNIPRTAIISEVILMPFLCTFRSSNSLRSRLIDFVCHMDSDRLTSARLTTFQIDSNASRLFLSIVFIF